MEFKRCSKGHFYDPSVSSTCPQCAAEAESASYQEPTTYFGSGNVAGVMEDYGETEPPVQPDNLGRASKGMNVSYDETLPPENGNGFETRDFIPDNSVEDYDDVTMTTIMNETPGFTPVVGWLVCVDGPAKGNDYRIRAGYNYIGRAEHMDVCVKGDQGIGRERHAMIAYDHEERVFFFGPADGKSIVRLNGKMVMVPAELHAYDILKIGSTKLMFVPLCGERFNWDA